MPKSKQKAPLEFMPIYKVSARHSPVSDAAHQIAITNILYKPTSCGAPKLYMYK